jgi:hypothetical protein
MTAFAEHGHFDAARWLAACLADPDGFVPASAEMAQLAAEHAYGRRFTIHPFRPPEHFTAGLLTVDRQRVTGGQIYASWAIVPTPEAGAPGLVPVLRKWMGPAIGSPGWVRVAGFLDTAAAKAGLRALHIAGRREGGGPPDWMRPDGTADVGAVERVLMAEGMMPGRLGASATRVYAWRR